MGGFDDIRDALTRKWVDTACRRCGKNEWSGFGPAARSLHSKVELAASPL